MRPIDADALTETFETKCVLAWVKNIVDNAPTIDTTPVAHGVWITKEYMCGDPDVGLEDMWIDRLAEATDYYAECSICGKNAGYDGEGNLILSDFCPSCGTKMDGGNHDTFN